MVLTDDAIDDAASSLQDYVDNNFSHGAIGTSTGTEDSSNDSLGNEILRKSRANLSDSNISNGSGDTTVSLFVNSTEANGNTIEEFGFFDAASAGELQSIDAVNSIDKNDGIELFFELVVNIDVSQ